MKRDPENHTRWKHKWRGHNLGNVLDKIATSWAGKDNWMKARKKKRTTEEKYKFVTFVLFKMKLPAEHRKSKSKVPEKKIKDKTP